MIFTVLLILYWFVSAVALLWVDERYCWDLTGRDPMLAGIYVLIAPMLVPIGAIAAVLWLLGAGVLNVAQRLAHRS